MNNYRVEFGYGIDDYHHEKVISAENSVFARQKGYDWLVSHYGPEDTMFVTRVDLIEEVSHL